MNGDQALLRASTSMLVANPMRSQRNTTSSKTILPVAPVDNHWQLGGIRGIQYPHTAIKSGGGKQCPSRVCHCWIRAQSSFAAQQPRSGLARHSLRPGQPCPRPEKAFSASCNTSPSRTSPANKCRCDPTFTILPVPNASRCAQLPVQVPSPLCVSGAHLPGCVLLSPYSRTISSMPEPMASSRRNIERQRGKKNEIVNIDHG